MEEQEKLALALEAEDEFDEGFEIDPEAPLDFSGPSDREYEPEAWDGVKDEDWVEGQDD